MNQLGIDGRIAQANGRLKAARLRVQIERRGDWLYCRGTFPPKPGSDRAVPYQQRIRLGCPATPIGIREAEHKAKEIGAALIREKFDWADYQADKCAPVQVAADAIAQFEQHYLANGGTLTTWKGDYLKGLAGLDLNKPITPGDLQRAIEATAPNTRSRKRAVMACTALGKFAGLDVNFNKLAGNYSPRHPTPRDLPSDVEIVEFWQSLTNPAWQWVFGVIAAYGLRPHEVFRIDFDRLANGDRVLHVGENTKTGERLVWPFYPEWVDSFNLVTPVLPKIKTDRSNEAIGHSATAYFKSRGMVFPLYSLRHRWAVRSLEFGLPVELASRQMGHSVDIHTQVYHHWITEDVHQRVYDRIVNHPDRPRSPIQPQLISHLSAGKPQTFRYR